MRKLAGVAVALSAVVLAGCSAQQSAGPAGPAGPEAPPASRAVVPSVQEVRAPATVAAPSVPSAPAAPTPAKAPRPNPCHHNRGGQLVRVSLHRQHLWMCKAKQVAYSSPITSGVVGQYTSTPTGNYTVQGLDRNTVLTLITGQQYTVKYWIPFDAPLFGFHDSPWQKFPYGSPKYRTQGSHGCVHLPLKTIRFLYHWAAVGTAVRIRA